MTDVMHTVVAPSPDREVCATLSLPCVLSPLPVGPSSLVAPRNGKDAMAFISAPGVLEVAQQFTTPGGNAYNIWHVAHLDSTSWTPAQITALLTVMNNWEQTTGRLRRVADITCQNYRARDLSSQFGSEASFSGNSSGTLAGASLPQNCTLAIKKETGVAGRGNRGRVYHVGCSESQTTRDTYAGAEVTALVTSYEALRTAVAAIANTALCIMKTHENKVVLNPRTFRVITDFVQTDGVMDSQRRRLTGHNIHR